MRPEWSRMPRGMATRPWFPGPECLLPGGIFVELEDRLWPLADRLTSIPVLTRSCLLRTSAPGDSNWDFGFGAVSGWQRLGRSESFPSSTGALLWQFQLAHDCLKPWGILQARKHRIIDQSQKPGIVPPVGALEPG